MRMGRPAQSVDASRAAWRCMLRSDLPWLLPAAAAVKQVPMRGNASAVLDALKVAVLYFITT